MKYLILALISISFSFQMEAQSNIVILINNKKAAEAAIKPDQKATELKIIKSQHKKCTPFIIQISGEPIGGEMYKSSLQIGEDGETNVEETKNKPGQFDISNSKTVKDLQAGKKIELYLLLNPTNPAMMFPSKRIFIGTVLMQ